MTPQRRCRTVVEVRYAETDQMGVVHHAVYPVWFELARTRLCAETGHRYSEIEERGFYLMVTGLELRFRAPARYGDAVDVDCWVERLGSRGLRFAYEVLRGEQRLVTGSTEHIWVERQSGRPSRAPAELQNAFATYAQTSTP